MTGKRFALDPKTLASLFDVSGNPFAQGVDGIEPDLLAQAPLEGQIDFAAVEIAREIDQVGLGDEISPVSEGRPKSHVGHHGPESVD